MNNNQNKKDFNLKNFMMKKTCFQNLFTLALIASVSACSLSKPGDKDRSTMLNGTGKFQTVSIAKKKPGQTASAPGSTDPDNAELTAASFSSGEKVALGQFVNNIAQECGDNSDSRKIVNISGNIGINVDAVKTMLEEKQKDAKSKPPFQVVATAMFGAENAEKIISGAGEPIVQWVNYCQSSSDDNKIFGWITDNTLKAQKTAQAPQMRHQSAPQAFSLAWAQHHLISNFLSIPSAIADDNTILNNVEVAVYPLVDSSISADSQITAKYVKTASAGALPESLKLKFGSSVSVVDSAINKPGTPEDERIIFSAEQWVIPPSRKAQIDGLNKVVFSTKETEDAGTSNIYKNVVVLDEAGTNADETNVITWLQRHLKQTQGIEKPFILINTGTTKAYRPDPEDISAMSEQVTAPSSTTVTESEDDAEVNDDTTNPTVTDDTAAENNNAQESFFTLPAWLGGSSGSASRPSSSRRSSSTRRPSSSATIKLKATPDPNLDPFSTISFTCPATHNLVSLDLSCTDCLGPALEEFGWQELSESQIKSKDNYVFLKTAFGDMAAENLIFTAKDSAEHSVNICFNDTEYMGSYTDANFQVSDASTHAFFDDKAFKPIKVRDINGEKHFVITVTRKVYYTAYPDVVNNLKTIVADGLPQVPAGETLFYQPFPKDNTYRTNETPDGENTYAFDNSSPEEREYARSLKKLQFVIPLNDLANMHQSVDASATVKIGTDNMSVKDDPDNPQSLLLKALAEGEPADPNDGLDYLISGEMQIGSVKYREQHHQNIYQSLGAEIVAAAAAPPASSSSDPIDLAHFQENMQDGSDNVSTADPGSRFAQSAPGTANFPGTLISHNAMKTTCNNYSYRFGISLKGRYTLVKKPEVVERELSAMERTMESVIKPIKTHIWGPIQRIAKKSKHTAWNVYVCSNTLDTGILDKNDYVAYLDTLPNADSSLAGVYMISKDHSNIVIESNASKDNLLVGLDIVSFDLHEGERVGEYLKLDKLLIVPAIKAKPPTRMTLQFTGQIQLDKRDIREASKAVSSRFHFADKLRRLPFTLNPKTNIFEVTTHVRETSPQVVLKDAVNLHKNSLNYQGTENYPGVDTSVPFDGYMQTFGELSPFQFGFWLEG